MDAIMASSSFQGMQLKENMGAVDRKLYRFISIIDATEELKVKCEEKKVVSWLSSRLAQVGMETEGECRDFIFPYLHLSSKSNPKKIQNRKKIALRYAKILAKYAPDRRGNINQQFSYYQLVWIIKTVFHEHIVKNEALFLGGIKIGFPDCSFYAKVEGKQIYIIAGLNTVINMGAYGTVCEVYELATRRFFALKMAHGNQKSVELMKNEIFNLSVLHAKAGYEGLSVSGLQALPIATYDYHHDGEDLVGFIGRKYEIDLLDWLDGDHSNEERIATCKSLIAAYKNKMLLGYWHGDIKPENILMSNEGVVIIDWAGALSMQQAVEGFVIPHTWTKPYMGIQERRCLLALAKSKTRPFEKSLKFIQMAQSADLFSLSLVLFMTLTSKKPFYFDGGRRPDTIKGFRPDSMDTLLQRHYNDIVVKTLIKMLAYDPAERYSPLEAIDIWEREI